MKQFIVPFIASEKLNARCDEILNCECDSRISDQGFLDVSKVMVRPRTGTETLGRVPAGLGSAKDFTWFIDDDNVKTGYVAKGGEIYKCTYRNIGQYLGYFQNTTDAAAVGVGSNYDYYIVHQTLYIFSGGTASDSGYTWTNYFDNEADLFEDYPVPEDDLFCFLRDSNSVYYSADGFWIPVAENYTMTAITLGNDADYPSTFNVVTLPIDYQIGDTARDTSAVELVKVSSSLEGTAATYVGSYLLITSGVYRGKYGYIFDFNTTTKEFAVISLGNATPIQSGTTYKIYEKKGKYLQITNGKDADKYYDGTAFNTDFEGFVRDHIQKFVGFPNGGPGIIRTFGNQSYTSIGDSVFISDVSQPLWYNINDGIDLQKADTVDDFFVWKNKMIAYGSTFTTFINPSVSSGADRTYDFKNYGIVPGSCAEVLDDFWLLTYSGQLIPLSVTINGSIYEKDNIGLPVYRYLKTMRNRVTSCFDGRKYYIYGEERNEEGYMCVYDTFYKVWSVWTGIRPVKMVVDAGYVYFIEYGTGDLKRFTIGKVTDSEVALDQYISSKDIDGGRSMILKTAEQIITYMENRNQDYSVQIQKRTAHDNVVRDYPQKIVEKRNDDLSPVLGYDFVDDPNMVPHFKPVPLGNDQANIWRWKISNTGTNGFYLNQLEMYMGTSETPTTANIEF